MKINTVNIIETANGEILSIGSFPDNSDGNLEAEYAFRMCAIANGFKRDDLPRLVEDGFAAKGSYELFLIHST